MYNYGCLGEYRIGDSCVFLCLRWPELALTSALPLRFLMLIIAGRVSLHQQEVIEHLQEENRAAQEQMGGKRLKMTEG